MSTEYQVVGNVAVITSANLRHALREMAATGPSWAPVPLIERLADPGAAFNASAAASSTSR